MKKDLVDLNAKNSTDIIIIAGDHGPYLTKNGIGLSPDYKLKNVNRLDIRSIWCALAIHWPEEKYIGNKLEFYKMFYLCFFLYI